METQITTEQVSHWVIEPRYSTVQFRIKLLYFLTVEGTLTDVSGSLQRDDTEIGRSSVEAIIKVESLSTGNRKRDSHLQSADFFDARQFPEIHFQSSKVEKGRDIDTLRLTGRLTIKGKDREVVLDVTEVDTSRSPQGDEVAYYAAQVKLNRSDYGITRFSGLISNALKVTIYIQALKKN